MQGRECTISTAGEFCLKGSCEESLMSHGQRALNIGNALHTQWRSLVLPLTHNWPPNCQVVSNKRGSGPKKAALFTLSS